MTQAGGPAAINGFLYQILHHLAWIANIELTGKLAEEDVIDARLIFEPRDGGDARCESVKVRLVEQYKVKTGGDIWSVREIIKQVLPDLRKAVPECYSKKELYRFVTDGRGKRKDGRPGALETFQEFINSIKQKTSSEQLDDKNQKEFGIEELQRKTDLGLFNYILESTTKTGHSRTNECATVFHLLAHFEMEFQITAETCSAKVEELLRRYVADLGDEKGKRNELVGILMKHLSKGEARLKVDDLLKEAGLNPERMRNLAKLSETTAALTCEQVKEWFSYDKKIDVKTGDDIDWPDDKPILLITGESGSGKSWDLARLVTSLGERRQITVIQQATSKDQSDDLLNSAANEIWQAGLGETNEKTLTALTSHYRELDPKAKWPWLTIAIDDVQNSEVAKKLIRQTWKRWGMRLVMTVPPDIAKSLEKEQTAKVFETEPFTIDELDEFLKKYGKRLLDLPSDLKKLLRTPILAGLYVKLSIQSIRTAPENEYEIFHRYWKERILRDRQQSTHRRDPCTVLTFAGRVIDRKSYPCDCSDWPNGLDDAALDRLETSGWLRCNEEGEVAFAHDRLLNWAVAKEVVRRFRKNLITSKELAELFAQCYAPFWWLPYPFAKELRYVPMDALWLLIAEEKNIQATTEIISYLEGSREYGPSGRVLYNLLPTLGQPIVPVLLARLDSLLEEEWDYRINLINQAFSTLAVQEGVNLRETVGELLKSSPERQNVALTILKSKPMPDFLDRLWVLYQKRYRAFNNQSNKNDQIYLDYKDVLAALYVCIQQDPEWLRQKILHMGENSECVPSLAYELYRLNDYFQAHTIWQETKEILCHKMFLDHSRKLPLISAQSILLYCIRRFSDYYAYHDFIIDSIFSGEDSTKKTAFLTLAYLVPDEAMKVFFSLDKEELLFSRNRWLPVLLQTRPKEIRAQLLAYAEKNYGDNIFIAGLFKERSDELDEALLCFLLRSLEKDMQNKFEQSCDKVSIHSALLNCLAGVTRPELLRILAKEAGGNFESMLAKLACNHVQKVIDGRVDEFLDHASRLLFKIGGDGFATLTNYELEYASHSSYADHHGLKWAIMVPPNEKTISLLAESACRHLMESEKPQYQLAVFALAALGADDALVDTLFRTGNPTTPPELAAMRFSKKPMDKAVTEPARRMLESSETKTEKELFLALTVAWVSADTDFIPLIQLELSRAEPSSSTARLAGIALQQLGEKSEQFAQLLVPLLKTEENKLWTTEILFALGNSATGALRDYLDGVKVNQWGHEEQAMIRFLHQQEAAQESVETMAAQYCAEARRSFFGLPYDIASKTDQPEIREMILDELFGKKSSDSTLRAIEGLANFNSDRAIQVIEDYLLQDPSRERRLCQLLVRIDPKIAPSLLMKIACSARREEKKKKNLYSAMGQALRRLEAKEVDEVLEQCLQDMQRGTRTLAATIAGWLPPGRLSESLGKLADHEMEEEVRLAALDALTRQRQEETVLELIRMFTTEEGRQRRWVYLHCILELGDPFLLSHQEEPLWLGHILENVPYAYIYHANSELERRRKQVES